MTPNPLTAVTPNRLTVVTFDTDEVRSIERVILRDRTMDELANPGENGTTTKTTLETLEKPGYNVVLREGHGWVLKDQHEAGENGSETVDFDSGDLAVSVTPNTILKQAYRANDDLPGVSLGGDQRASGYGVYQKNVGVGQSFDANLSADQAAFPGPEDIGVQPLVRIAVSDDDLTLGDKLEYGVTYYKPYNAPRIGELSRVYFGGPAGSKEGDAGEGTGNYCLRFLGTGKAILLERLDNEGEFFWQERMTFFWTNDTLGGFQKIYLSIWTDAIRQPNGTYQGSVIYFYSYSFGGSTIKQFFDLLLELGKRSIGAKRGVIPYVVPAPRRYPYRPCKFRIDDRVDTRSEWKITKAKYFRSGSIKCKVEDIGAVVTSAEPLYFHWFGYRPESCTVNIQLFDAETNLPLTPVTSNFQGEYTGYRGFDPTSGRTPDTVSKQYTRRNYYAVIELGSDGNETPVIRTSRFWRPEVNGSLIGESISAGIVASISVTGQDADPSHETAKILIHDLKDELSMLQARAQMGMRIDVRYDPEDETKVSTLFTGYLARADRTTRGGASNGRNNLAHPAYPAQNWASYDCRCTGEWQRLFEAVTSQCWSFAVDARAPLGGLVSLPWPITDIIKHLLKDAGYGDDQILVSDLPLRFFGTGDVTKIQMVQPFSPIYPVIAQLALSYLGGWIHWDANASGSETPDKMGAWRLRMPSSPVEGVYKTLVHFKKRPNLVSTALRWGYSVDAQAVETGLDDQPIKTIWVRKGSLKSYVVPPEANMIVVTGTGKTSVEGTSGAGSSDATQGYSQVAINYESTRFANDQPIEPDPGSPDYLSRQVKLYYGDKGLTSKEAVDFTCRRLYDMACHGQKRISFEAPLVLITDVTDEYQRQPRPLMYGDMVKFEGENFVVSSCCPTYSGGGSGRSMMAVYELFSPSPLSMSGNWAPRGMD